MSDYISRKAIITWIEKSLAMYHDKYSTDMLHMFGLFRSAIEDKSLFPAADVVERKAGKWEQKEVFDILLCNIEQLQSAFCPICKRYHTTPYSYYFKHYNFCPHCGARMVSE